MSLVTVTGTVLSKSALGSDVQVSVETSAGHYSHITMSPLAAAAYSIAGSISTIFDSDDICTEVTL